LSFCFDASNVKGILWAECRITIFTINKGYNDCKGNLEVDMEEYPDGLRKKVYGDLKRVEDDIAMSVYESRRRKIRRV